MIQDSERTAVGMDTDQETTRYAGEDPAPPSLWSSVFHAFQHARLVRLEARVRRLRQRAMGPPVASQQPLVILAAERVHSHPDSAWIPISTTVSRRRVATLVVVVVVALCGIALSQLPPRPRGLAAAAVPAPPPEPQAVNPPQETTPGGTTLATLEERLVTLRQQVDQHGDQLTNQTSVVESVSQQTDNQRTQLTTLADALATLSDQVQHVEQQLTTQATRVAAHEKQLARQATQLGQWREPTGVLPVSPVDHSRPGPPTLELLVPPSTTATAPVPNATASVPTPVGQTPRRAITLPASLGAVGLRTAPPTTPGGPQS